MTASSSPRLMCAESLLGHSQAASSITLPLTSRTTPTAMLLASTHTLIEAYELTSQSPFAGSPQFLSNSAASRNLHMVDALTGVSQSTPSEAVQRCRKPLATRSQFATGKWPTHSPRIRCTCWRVSGSLLMSGSCLSRLQRNCESTDRPRTRTAALPRYSGSLVTRPHAQK